jgi:hypothetical protein
MKPVEINSSQIITEHPAVMPSAFETLSKRIAEAIRSGDADAAIRWIEIAERLTAPRMFSGTCLSLAEDIGVK